MGRDRRMVRPKGDDLYVLSLVFFDEPFQIAQEQGFARSVMALQHSRRHRQYTASSAAHGTDHFFQLLLCCSALPIDDPTPILLPIFLSTGFDLMEVRTLAALPSVLEGVAR